MCTCVEVFVGLSDKLHHLYNGKLLHIEWAIMEVVVDYGYDITAQKLLISSNLL